MLAKAYHPFDKLIIGLPPAMPSWVRAYGPATEWLHLPPNPLIPSVRRQLEAGDANTAAVLPTPSSADAGVRDHDRSPPPSASRHSPKSYRCDTCDRDFASEEMYEAHMKSHIYCTVPGCHFTCRDTRAHLMQEHMDALHNRPDAPNLVDTGAYLEQRKRRFPTQEVIKDKVEELYYKAARGVVLPEERRRWLRQHGVDVGKRARTEASFIARGSVPEEGARSPSAQSNAGSGRSSELSESRQHRRSPLRSPAEEHREEPPQPRFIQPPAALLPKDPTAAPPSVPAASEQPPMAPPQQSSPTPTAATSSSPLPSRQPPTAASHQVKMIPLGPNGTLTPRQRVQLVRERYAAAKEVPQFYVCHRCGRKGEHWVDDCPTKDDATYNRHVVWGEAKMEVGEGGKARSRAAQKGRAEPNSRDVPPEMVAKEEVKASPPPQSVQQEASTDPQESPQEAPHAEEKPEEKPDATSSCADHDISASTAPAHSSTSGAEDNDKNNDDDAPPVPQSAAPPADAPVEVTRVMAPVAAARYAQQRRDPPRRPPPPPTLYERLTEEERMNEQGLLLQAMRFFTARDFFQEKKQ